ncbi:hypothetical protein AURDEDRAFT_164707 [Auricularia subglabra TFB-10046 SS5]|nr:hypothetical protein AURDEDRAFT_164707 [Auricularia subglabra TFB-10046 SS5]
MFMLFVNSEMLLARVKAAADDWEIPPQLKALCRARIVACLLSPHIPEYRRNLLKHLVTLIPPSSKHLLPDETATTHKDLLKTFISDYATTVRNTIKSQIVKSMTKFDASTNQDVLDSSQGWCIGRLSEEIVAKLGTDADILVTTEVQSRVALLRWVYAAHPAAAPGPQYWILVDDTLAKQRQLDAASMARDITDGLADDIKQYAVDSDQPFALVDAKSISSESMQGVADTAMRNYYKSVKVVPAKRKSPPK